MESTGRSTGEVAAPASNLEGIMAFESRAYHYNFPQMPVGFISDAQHRALVGLEGEFIGARRREYTSILARPTYPVESFSIVRVAKAEASKASAEARR